MAVLALVALDDGGRIRCGAHVGRFAPTSSCAGAVLLLRPLSLCCFAVLLCLLAVVLRCFRTPSLAQLFVAHLPLPVCGYCPHHAHHVLCGVRRRRRRRCCCFCWCCRCQNMRCCWFTPTMEAMREGDNGGCRAFGSCAIDPTTVKSPSSRGGIVLDESQATTTASTSSTSTSGTSVEEEVEPDEDEEAPKDSGKRAANATIAHNTPPEPGSSNSSNTNSGRDDNNNSNNSSDGNGSGGNSTNTPRQQQQQQLTEAARNVLCSANASMQAICGGPDDYDFDGSGRVDLVS